VNEFERLVDILAILRVLAKLEVDFVVIGAVAVARHGFAGRDTDLADIRALREARRDTR
jgi:hypothetical protein